MAKAESQAILRAAESEKASLVSDARAEAKRLTDAADALVSESGSLLSAAQSDLRSFELKLSNLAAEEATTQAELDRTFILNFGKKGELKDSIKALRKEQKAISKQVDDAGKAVETAQKALDKQTEAARKQQDAADKLLADGTKKGEKVLADAEKRSDKILKDADKASAGALRAAEREAQGLRKLAAKAAIEGR